MNIILRKLTNEMYNSNTDYFSKSIGNYRVVRNRKFIFHYYFGNRICLVDLEESEFSLYNCGYKKYRLTTAQLKFLKQFYKNKNYNLIYEGK